MDRMIKKFIVIIGLLLSFTSVYSHNDFKIRIDSLEKSLNVIDNQAKIRVYHKIALIYYQEDSLFQSHKYAKLGITLAEKLKNNEDLSELHSLIGYIYTSWANYPKAISHFAKSIQSAQKSKNKNGQIAGFHGMGRVYNEVDDFKNAEKSFFNALNLIENKKTDPTLRAVFNDMGVMYMKKKEYKKSIEYLQKALEISKRKGDTASWLYSLINIGEVYRYSEDLDNAEKFYQKAIYENRYLNNIQAQSAAYGNLAHVYFKRKDYDKAKDYYLKSIKISKSSGLSNYLIESYKAISELYLQIGDYKNSLEYLVLYDNLKDSLFNQGKITEIQNLQTQFEIDRKDVETRYWMQKYRNRNIIMFSTIGLVVFVIVILILLFSRYKLNQKLHQIEKKKLNLTIDEKNREMVGLLLHSTKKENLYEDLHKEIETLSKNPENIESALHNIKKRIKSDSVEENNWESVRIHFEQVHPDFFNKLLEKFPNLSQGDLKLCAYIKINMTSNDIAIIMHIGIRAVQTARYRLKKKLNLAESEDLVQFLQNI